MPHSITVVLVCVLLSAVSIGAACPESCHSDDGWGQCDSKDHSHLRHHNSVSATHSAGCVCEPGHGGQDCSFQMSSLYFGEDVYDGLVTSQLELDGWNNDDESISLYERLCEEVKPNLIIEVGVWKGQSASYLAGWLKQQNRGVFLAVDTWLGAPEYWTAEHQDLGVALRRKNGYPQVFYTFLSNMKYLGLEQFVVPFPSDSPLACHVMLHNKVQADLIHIDAAHEYESVLQDMQLWWDVLAPGGVLLGDDIEPEAFWPGVKKAVKEFSQNHNVSYQVQGHKWFIHKGRADTAKSNMRLLEADQV